MRTLTAIDLLGIPAARSGDWGYQHLCPRCDSGAWSGAQHMQCFNPLCDLQVASPLDLVAEVFDGDYEEADRLVAKSLLHDPTPRSALRRSMERAVMNAWLAVCLSPPSMEQLRVISREYRKSGWDVKNSFAGSVPLDRKQIRMLMAVASDTGGRYPESWDETPPRSALAFCVQSVPHTIDRIILILKGGRIREIVWKRYSVGFTGLIGLSPYQPKILSSDLGTSLLLQRDLASVGRMGEVASVFVDKTSKDCPTWKPDGPMLLAAPGNDRDVILMQSAFDQIAGFEERVIALPRKNVLEDKSWKKSLTWAGLRRGMIIRHIKPFSQEIPQEAAMLFERTGSRQSDAIHIINRLKDVGCMKLAEDFQVLAEDQVLYEDHLTTVRASANDYSFQNPQGTFLLANFRLKLSANVTFPDRDTRQQGILTCGKSTIPVLLTSEMLRGNTKALQEYLHQQHSIHRQPKDKDLLPTIVNPNAFQKFILPHLRTQMAEAPVVQGASYLGWSSDRKSYQVPGFSIDLGGCHPGNEVLYPGIASLRSFGPVTEWAHTCPKDLDPSCQDLIAMYVASCVRHYRRFPVDTLDVLQTSESVAILEGLAEAMGQHSIFELSSNDRDSFNGVEGVTGYPLLVAGVGAVILRKTKIGLINLTDTGYRVHSEPDKAQIATAGRGLQFALQRVVEWCLATGADDFRMMKSVNYHAALMREGMWLIENVCKLQPWEISAKDLDPIEEVLGQIPPQETASHFTLVDGETLIIDLAGLKYDQDGILSCLMEKGSLAAFENEKMVAPAATILPDFAKFYGHEPSLKNVLSKTLKDE